MIQYEYRPDRSNTKQHWGLITLRMIVTMIQGACGDKKIVRAGLEALQSVYEIPPVCPYR